MAGIPPKEHQFKPGESGNPNGRPKGALSMATIIRKFLNVSLKDQENPLTGEVEILTAQELMVLKQLAKAIDKGDTKAFTELVDRLEGKPSQTVLNEFSEAPIKTINIIPASKAVKYLQNGNGQSHE